MRRRDGDTKPDGLKKAPPGEDRLLTAEELFGDLVDGPVPPKEGPEARKSSPRVKPIRVRINEPSPSPMAGQGPEGELPADVQALLERLEPLMGRTPAEPFVPPDPTEGAPPKPPPEFSPVDQDDDLLARLTSLPGDGADAPNEDMPRVTARTAPKFQVATAHTDAPAQGGLDLAALAEEAIGPEDESKERPEKGTWRDDVYGPYQLEDRIAVGGMAEVFKAKRAGAAGFEKTLAIKRILPHLSDNEEFVNMFVDEAKMVAGLTHPNIVQILDLGKLEKSYFIAMEYVHGRDLRTILKRAKEKDLRLPLDLSLRIVGALCAALEFAHRKKDERGRPMEIVHRDVSPQNILISFEGDVKLTDFGIAKAATKASNTDRGALRASSST